MAANEQAYTGFGTLEALGAEWNRLQFAIRMVLNGTATATLVQVKAVKAADGDAKGYVVDVQPMVSQVDGAGNAVQHGTIHALPVWRVQGGISAVIVKPKVNDIGLAVFASTDISGVKRKKKPTTPGSARRFDWADGIYLGGLLNPTPTQYIEMSEDDGITIKSTSKITIDAPEIDTKGTLKNNDVDVGSTHAHSGVQTGSGDTGPPT